MKKKTKDTVAAFDFDGTISYRDTLLPFLFFTTGYLKSFLYLLIELPYILGFIIGIVSRQKAKEKVITRFFKGKSKTQMEKLGESFAQNVLPKCIRNEALQRIQWHILQGHHCILISASIDVYLIPWAISVGFKDILTSSLEIDKNGKVTGRLKGKNCWGPEKVCRLKTILPDRASKIVYAYGDSLGDRELLNYADHTFYRTME